MVIGPSLDSMCTRTRSLGGCRVCLRVRTTQHLAQNLYYFLRLERFEGRREEEQAKDDSVEYINEPARLLNRHS